MRDIWLRAVRILVNTLGLVALFGTIFAGSLTKTTEMPHPEEKYAYYTRFNGPGMAVMVMKAGMLLKADGFGLGNLSQRTLIRKTTNFNLASDSKQFTAAGILLLEQDGHLSPEDQISKYLPNLPAFMKHIRVRHLLYHTSGLPDYTSICQGSELTRTVTRNADVLEYLRVRGRLDFPSGSRFEYSNTGYVILSELIERISGKPFPEFIRNRIFVPLSMDHSYVFTPEDESIIPERSLGYSSWPWLNVHDYNSCNYIFGDGGIYTSIEDYAKWGAALQEGRLFKPQFQAKLWKSGKTEGGQEVNYSYGWGIEQYEDELMISHSGAWVGFRSIAAYLPKRSLWVAIFSNYSDAPVDEALHDYLKEYSDTHSDNPERILTR